MNQIRILLRGCPLQSSPTPLAQRILSGPVRTGIGALLLLGIPFAAAILDGCKPASKPGAPVPVAAAGIGRPDAPIAESRLAEYAGSESCIRCHSQYKDQLDSHHAHTLAKVDAATHGELFKKSAQVKDPRLSVQYGTAVQGDQCVMQASQGGAKETVPAEYAFGSGNRCFTYVGSYEGRAVELRASWFRRVGRWDFTPGQTVGGEVTTPVGRVLDLQEATECLMCHSDAVVATGGQPQPERSLLGITCEGCHGPGKAHIQAVELKLPDLKMERMGQNRADVAQRLCGSCHRTRETGGDPHDPVTQGQLPRLQGMAMALSKCFIKSEGKMSCVTCHDPHKNADQTTRVEYNAQCRSCHQPQKAQQVACPTQPAGDCVSCHMPLQEVNMPTRPKFPTHYIKVWTDAKGRSKRPDMHAH